MKHSSFILVPLLTLLLTVSCQQRPGKIEIYATTDLHGMLLPFDNTEGRSTGRSLANVASVVKSRESTKIVLLDNGDILQGDPLAYYYNFIDTTREHVVADILNHLGYDAATVGNHDIEAGHAAYDRVRRQYNFPLLAANAVHAESGEPYFEPYTLIKKGGLTVAVFGLITPSVPRWLPESLYEGIRFENMVETAARWMPVIKGENPDLIVGLFHSGMGDEEDTGEDENSTLAVAVNVPGFDIIFCGHDHRQDVREMTAVNGDRVLILDGGSRAEALMNATVSFGKKSDGTVEKQISGRVISMDELPESLAFIKRYRKVSDSLKAYTSEVIGKSTASFDTRDAFFGPSAFVDLIHLMQLDISGADISFAAPLSFDQGISEGELRIQDMYRLYRFENFLYTIKMTGGEIDRHLEHAAGLWFDTMDGTDDYMLRYRYNDSGKPIMINGTARLRNPSYNFESAMGIRYTIDVSKPQGARVTILSLDDGTPFSHGSTYTVAVNSYRANGGGGHFPAARITNRELARRMVSATERDLRHYMTEWIRDRGTISPEPLSDWKIIPEEWASAAAERETKLLFGNN
ncbi:MAG: bifunctional UDP-sugar hydrolase/5'-nucleotidase [Bacteroidales bacterium]|nr:bifunctional UDP-sugar hydrolase/5'-nucleotidase [Bacteroidales bacterium]MDT8372887.1 bifunctional UDP-sugar hydrolase/5'-nucleotidase [Bacteroidales bacterium]